MAEKFRAFETGINGQTFDHIQQDIKNLKRVDESWPEDEFGSKLSLGPNYGDLLHHKLGTGDIEMQGNAEAIDPPRKPQPGSRQFGERAKQRRRRLMERAQARPDDPEDVTVTDVTSGEKKSLKKRRQELEEALDF